VERQIEDAQRMRTEQKTEQQEERDLRKSGSFDNAGEKRRHQNDDAYQ
jgi:hypothetical protein